MGHGEIAETATGTTPSVCRSCESEKTKLEALLSVRHIRVGGCRLIDDSIDHPLARCIPSIGKLVLRIDREVSDKLALHNKLPCVVWAVNNTKRYGSGEKSTTFQFNVGDKVVVSSHLFEIGIKSDSINGELNEFIIVDETEVLGVLS